VIVIVKACVAARCEPAEPPLLTQGGLFEGPLSATTAGQRSGKSDLADPLGGCVSQNRNASGLHAGAGKVRLVTTLPEPMMLADEQRMSVAPGVVC